MTRPAAAYRDAMRGRERAAYDAWLKDLRSRGCKAAGYRLRGDTVDRLCCKHLSDTTRAVVAFESPTSATIVLLGKHDSSNPAVDVYTALYRLAGIDIPDGPRTKPSCCDDAGFPPDAGSVAEELVARVRTFEREGRRRRR
jgi:hypothetical protein